MPRERWRGRHHHGRRRARPGAFKRSRRRRSARLEQESKRKQLFSRHRAVFEPPITGLGSLTTVETSGASASAGCDVTDPPASGHRSGSVAEAIGLLELSELPCLASEPS